MAARRSEQRLYEVYLARVIKIPAVQCHRAAVTDDDTAQVLLRGLPPETTGDFLWSLDAPEEVSLGARGAVGPISPPMQLAWNAAVAAFKEFIDAIENGELIASGVHPATGVRHESRSGGMDALPG